MPIRVNKISIIQPVSGAGEWQTVVSTSLSNSIGIEPVCGKQWNPCSKREGVFFLIMLYERCYFDAPFNFNIVIRHSNIIDFGSIDTWRVHVSGTFVGCLSVHILSQYLNTSSYFKLNCEHCTNVHHHREINPFDFLSIWSG